MQFLFAHQQSRVLLVSALFSCGVLACGSSNSSVVPPLATQNPEGAQSQDGNPSPKTAGAVRTVPYFSQYSNKNEPGSTCGITSVAMVLSSFLPEQNLTPDDLYKSHGKSAGQSPESITALVQSYGLFARPTRVGSRIQMKEHLRAGRLLVAHGNFTSSGHVVAIVGATSNGFIVNDPAGNYLRCYHCEASGKEVVYKFGSSADNALSTDGDIWFTVVAATAF